MTLTLKETRKLLEQLQIFPKKKLGQNFLIEPSFVRRALEWACVSSEDVVVEIGPGLGTLTEALLDLGAKVYAVEKDAGLFDFIANKFKTQQKIFNCQRGNAIEAPTGNLRVVAGASFKVVANLPYAIASIWLDCILELPVLPQKMVLMVQKEAAERWFSSPGTKSFCPLAICLQSAYRLENKCLVSKRCFYPQPKVDSVLLGLSRQEHPFIFDGECKRFLRSIFTHRRQQLGRICKENPHAFSLLLSSFLEGENFEKSIRAEALPVHFWQSFQKRLKQ